MTAGAAGSAEVPGAEAGDRPAARTWAAAAGAPYRWRWAAFAVVLIASLVTNVAGPAIRADLGGGSTLIQWLGAGYTLAIITGAALAAAASALLVYPVVEGRTLGWPPWAFALMAASVAVFAAFGWLETRKERAGGQPLIIPALFREPAFIGGLVSGLAFFTAITGFSLVLTVYLQVGLGYSPLKAGLTALPQAAGSVAGFIAAGAGLATRLGRTCIHIGTGTMAAGILAVILTLNIAAIPVTPWELASALAVMGAGMGLVLAPFFDIVLAGVEPHETGSASGTLTAVQQFGSALGVAVMGSIFFGLLTGPTRAAFTAALRHTLWAVAGLQLLTFALAFLLPRRAAPAVQGHPASSHDGKAGT